MDTLICCAYIPEYNESMTYGKFACSHVVGCRCVKSYYAVLRACLYIDIVDTRARAADSLKTVCVVEEFRTYLGGRSYDKSIKTFDMLIDLLL